jgi:hypothetical protein
VSFYSGSEIKAISTSGRNFPWAFRCFNHPDADSWQCRIAEKPAGELPNNSWDRRRRRDWPLLPDEIGSLIPHENGARVFAMITEDSRSTVSPERAGGRVFKENDGRLERWYSDLYGDGDSEPNVILKFIDRP